MSNLQVPEIKATTVLADGERPLMSMRTRWEYLAGFLEHWKAGLRYRLYAFMLGILALYFLFINQVDFLALVCATGAAFFYGHFMWKEHIITSDRRVIVAK